MIRKVERVAVLRPAERALRGMKALLQCDEQRQQLRGGLCRKDEKSTVDVPLLTRFAETKRGPLRKEAISKVVVLEGDHLTTCRILEEWRQRASNQDVRVDNGHDFSRVGKRTRPLLQLRMERFVHGNDGGVSRKSFPLGLRQSTVDYEQRGRLSYGPQGIE